MKEILISANDSGQRVDRFLKKYLAKAPLSAIYKIIRKDVKLNGKRPKENAVLSEGDVLCLYMMDEEIAAWSEKEKRAAVKRQFKIAYEDENILAAEKPFGLLTHGDATEKKNTLANQVTDYLIAKGEYSPAKEKSFRPAPANRLDRNTTGLVMFGKNAAALRCLNALFADKESGRMRKIYLAICEGEIKEDLVLEGWLLKDEKTNKVKILKKEAPGAKYIKTSIRPLAVTKRGDRDADLDAAPNERAAKGRAQSRAKTLCEIDLVTGRPHQIRAHLASIGYPVMGDPKYGKGSAQMLHASRIEFVEPEGELSYLAGRVITAELPPKFMETTEKLFGKDILK